MPGQPYTLCGGYTYTGPNVHVNTISLCVFYLIRQGLMQCMSNTTLNSNHLYNTIFAHMIDSKCPFPPCFTISHLSADTTDVQSAEAQYDNNQTVAVTCHFAEGSQALGCHMQLNFSNDYQAVNISREGGLLTAHQFIETHLPAHCYQSQLYVYDWEADGTVGTLPVPVETMLSEGALAACELITPTTEAVNPGECLCTSDLCCINCYINCFFMTINVCVYIHPHTLVQPI